MDKYCFYIHHLLKEDLFYVGITKQNPRKRFRNMQYETTSLFKYLNLRKPLLENPNIETVCTEPLYTYDEAKFIEDWFITAFKPGKCINQVRSGLRSYQKGYNSEYYKQYYQEHCEQKKAAAHNNYYERKHNFKEWYKKHKQK